MPEPSFHQAGVNYQGDDSTKWAADKAYFKSIKSPNARFPIRIMSSPARIPVPFALGAFDPAVNNYTYRFALAKFFADDPDFDVIFNVNYGPITKDNWPGIVQSTIDLAAYMQSVHMAVEISLGNEMEGPYGLVFKFTGATQSGGIATVTMPSAFPTHVGDTFTIFGASRSQYNGVKTVLSYNGDKVITFAIDPATPTGATTGSAMSFDLATMNAQYRTLATAVKTVYNLGPISYGCYNSPVNGALPYDDWIANGTGDMDYLSIHTYLGATGKPAFFFPFPADALAVMTALGSKCYVSEFNLSSSSIANAMNETGINAMRYMFRVMNQMNQSRAVVWSFDTNLPMRNADGTYHPVWSVLLSNNGRLGIANLNSSRINAIGRASSGSRPSAATRVAVA